MSNMLREVTAKASDIFAGFNNKQRAAVGLPPRGQEAQTLTREQRRDRQEAAQSSAGLRAARGRGRGYRSLLSDARMEDQQGKGSKTTLGG